MTLTYHVDVFISKIVKFWKTSVIYFSDQYCQLLVELRGLIKPGLQSAIVAATKANSSISQLRLTLGLVSRLKIDKTVWFFTSVGHFYINLMKERSHL